jgi:hypothetical protein
MLNRNKLRFQGDWVKDQKMKSGKVLLPLVFFIMSVFCFFRSNSQDINSIIKPLTKKEIPVANDKMPDYIWEQVKQDPFTKVHLGWKLAYIQHPMYLHSVVLMRKK